MSAKNLFEAFQATLARHGDRPAFRFISDMGQMEPELLWTYRDFMEKLCRTANLFRGQGIDASSSVALMVPNVPYGQLALFAAEIAGRALPINPFLQDDHVVALLNAANVKVLIVSDDLDRALRLQSKVPSLETVFSLEEGPQGLPEAINNGGSSALQFKPACDPHAIVATFHTGGTTGAPKLAQHSLANQLAVARGMGENMDLSDDDVIVNALPLFHVAGSMCFALSALLAGACQMLCTREGARHPDFVAKHWLMAARHNVTIVGGVPTTIGGLLSTVPDILPPSIRGVITGGAMVPLAMEKQLTQKLGFPPVIVYGMTECAGLLASGTHGKPTPPGWIGKAINGMEIRIVANPSDVAGTTLPPGQTGHVVARGNTVGPGYTDASLNKTTFTSDGWLVTGDLGVMDEVGNLRLTGRAKDLIIRSGHNIDPALIEDAATTFPGVASAAAVGAPDGYAGELPVLYVTLEPGATSLDTDALLDVIKQEVERPAVPKWIEIIDAMPQTAVGKIYKPALMAQAIDRTLAGAISKAKLDERITVRVTDRNGLADICFHAAPTLKGAIDDIMAPYPLSYKIVPPAQ